MRGVSYVARADARGLGERLRWVFVECKDRVSEEKNVDLWDERLVPFREPRCERNGGGTYRSRKALSSNSGSSLRMCQEKFRPTIVVPNARTHTPLIPTSFQKIPCTLARNVHSPLRPRSTGKGPRHPTSRVSRTGCRSSEHPWRSCTGPYFSKFLSGVTSA